MARSRNIKPGFFSNDDLADCQPLARLLFIGLWCVADREGRMEDRPRRIRAEILPYDGCDIDALLNELQEHGFILRYEVGGEKYIQVLNFTKHQNPHMKEAKSTIPAPGSDEPVTGEIEVSTGKSPDERETGNDQAPEEHHTSTVQEPEKHNESPADCGFLIPDSLNPIKPHSQSAGEDSSSGPGAPNQELVPEQPAFNPTAPSAMTLDWEPDQKLLGAYAFRFGVPLSAFTPEATAPFVCHHAAIGRLEDQAVWVSKLVAWVKRDTEMASKGSRSNVKSFPGQSRHSGFDDRDYTKGLTQREDGTYAF